MVEQETVALLEDERVLSFDSGEKCIACVWVVYFVAKNAVILLIKNKNLVKVRINRRLHIFAKTVETTNTPNLRLEIML